MPAVYTDIRELLLNPDATIDDFVSVVEADSMLTLRVIRMAQSPYFGFPRPCENLYQAISLIGLMQLHDLMLGALCVRTFSTVPEEVLNLRAFWHYNVQCGIAAKTLARFSQAENFNGYFTLGLLHEVGHASMFIKEPEASLRALDDSLSGYRSVAEAERDYLGFDYSQVGAETMHLWHLPPVYSQVATHHLDPAGADEEFRPAVSIVHLAHEICEGLGLGTQHKLIRHARSTNPQFAGLPDTMGELITEEINTHADDVLGLLWPRPGDVSEGLSEHAYVD